VVAIIATAFVFVVVGSGGGGGGLVFAFPLVDHYHDTASLHPKDLRRYGFCGRGRDCRLDELIRVEVSQVSGVSTSKLLHHVQHWLEYLGFRIWA